MKVSEDVLRNCQARKVGTISVGNNNAKKMNEAP